MPTSLMLVLTKVFQFSSYSLFLSFSSYLSVSVSVSLSPLSLSCLLGELPHTFYNHYYYNYYYYIASRTTTPTEVIAPPKEVANF